MRKMRGMRARWEQGMCKEAIFYGKIEGIHRADLATTRVHDVRAER